MQGNELDHCIARFKRYHESMPLITYISSKEPQAIPSQPYCPLAYVGDPLCNNPPSTGFTRIDFALCVTFGKPRIQLINEIKVK